MFVVAVGNESPVQRCAEEEITFPIPVVQEEIKATVTREPADIGDLDRAFLDREVGEKNVTDPNTHSGMVAVDTTDVYFYFRGWESWTETMYGWTRHPERLVILYIAAICCR